jgi:DNA-binding GntR family transcriptional regulator
MGNSQVNALPRRGAVQVRRRRQTNGRRTLREEVRDRLMQDILTGVRAPGERIVEMRVAQQFHVSQGAVREALRDLESFGFVTSSPFRGAVVKEMSLHELFEVYPIRAALEAIAAKAAATRITNSELQRLRTLLQTMRKAGREGDERACVNADFMFHLTIVKASGNWLLRQFWERMRLANTTFITVSKTKHSLFDMTERHVPLLRALEQRNPKLAARVTRKHIETAAKWLRASLKEEERRVQTRPLLMRRLILARPKL